MKNFHRRLAASLLSAVLLTTALPTGALAEEPEEVPQANAEPVCTCTIPCTEETRNAECAACGADGAAPEACPAANASDTQTEEAVPVQEDTIAQRSVQDDVAYVDETGAVQTQDGVTEVTAEDTTWESGWYVAQGDVIIDHRVVVNGTVVLILADDCTLTVNGGINVSAGNSFTVYAQEAGTGVLTATGGSKQAGIGGAEQQGGGTIIIHGGNITAQGGSTGAGIGGGSKGSGGTIAIHGGKVTAQGGYSGAGIGGGWTAGGGTIRIAGGIVQASSDGDNTAAIGDGAYHDGKETSIAITGGIVTASGQYGIGRGNTSEPYPSAYRGKFSITGNAVIFTKGITDISEQDQWNGIVFFSTSGQVYGDSVMVDTDFTIPEGYTLTIPDDGTLCVGDGVTITNDGSIENYGTIQSQGDGTIANHPANHRMVLEVLNPDGQDAGERLVFGQEVTLKATGTNLPAEGETVSFFYGIYPLGNAVVTDDMAVLQVQIPEHQEPDVNCGNVAFQAKAGEVTGIRSAKVRLNASLGAPVVQSVTAGSITLGELDITNGCDVYQPRVVCRYQEEGKTDIRETAYPLIENLQPNTTYSVSVRIVGDEHYCDTDFTDPITITTSPAQTAFPAEGLNLADGAVSIQAGDESGKLQVRHHHEVYNVDSAQVIPITGMWEGEGAQNGGLDMETPISVSQAGNVWISLSDVSIQTGTQNDWEMARGISVYFSDVRLTLKGNNRIGGVGQGLTLFSGSLAIDGSGSLVIGSPDAYAQEGISVYDAEISLTGGQVVVYDESNSTMTVQGKCAVSILNDMDNDSVQAVQVFQDGRPYTGGWGAIVSSAYNWSSQSQEEKVTLLLPDDGAMYTAYLLVNGQMKEFHITTGEPQSVVPVENDLQITVPPEAELPLEGDGSGNLILPEGSTVQNGSGPAVTLPDGGAVSESGTVTGPVVETGDTTMTAPEGEEISVAPDGTAQLPAGSTVQTGDGPAITVSGEGTTVTPSGEVALPGGGSVSMTDGQGNTTTIAVPVEGGSIAPDGNNGITVPDGSTIQTGNGPSITVNGEGAAVNPEGEITLPGGGSATVNDGAGNAATVTVPPAGGTIVPNADGSVTLPGGSTVQTGDQTVTIPDGGGTIHPDGEIRYTVTVTFDSQGGSAVSAQEVMIGSLLTQPEQPVWSGYRFTGWYQDAACTVAWNFADMTVTSDLTLYAGWKKISSGGGSGSSGSSSGNSGSENKPSDEQTGQSNPFTDVAEDAYYHDAVLWAVENGITAGLTETVFGPNQACTRAQIVTFLWRAAGSPAPTATENPFADIAQDAYYYDAVLWAAEQGITGGTGAETFSPNATVTRAQTVAFLYRAAGSPAVSGSGFADVAADAYYADAVAWAADQGITSGTTAETFSPAQVCTRAQIVTFLYRDRA